MSEPTPCKLCGKPVKLNPARGDWPWVQPENGFCGVCSATLSPASQRHVNVLVARLAEVERDRDAEHQRAEDCAAALDRVLTLIEKTARLNDTQHLWALYDRVLKAMDRPLPAPPEAT